MHADGKCMAHSLFSWTLLWQPSLHVNKFVWNGGLEHDILWLIDLTCQHPTLRGAYTLVALHMDRILRSWCGWTSLLSASAPFPSSSVSETSSLLLCWSSFQVRLVGLAANEWRVPRYLAFLIRFSCCCVIAICSTGVPLATIRSPTHRKMLVVCGSLYLGLISAQPINHGDTSLSMTG